MPHIDEGLLHAYVDGEVEAANRSLAELEEHLAQCAPCRARLDDARAVRARAGALLDAARPERIHQPPFEAIQTRARIPRRVPTAGPSVLRWVAVIGLAAAAGWFARGLLQPGGEVAGSVGIPTLPTVTAEGIAPDTPVAAPETRRPRAEGAPAEPGVETAAPDITMLAALPGDSIPVGDQGARPGRIPNPAAAEAAPSRAAKSLEEARARQQGAPVPARADEAAPATAPAFSEQALRAGAQPLAAWAWRRATRDEAARHLGVEPFVAELLPVVEFAVGRAAGRPAVRLIQALPSGAQVELVQWVANDSLAEGDITADRLAEPEAAGDARSGVVWRQGTLLIVARAPIPEDSLRSVLGVRP